MKMDDLKLLLTQTERSYGIQTRDLLMVYDDPAIDSGFIALRGIELDIPPGSLISIIGPSGAGKSTLLKVLGGIFPPTAGEIFIGDIPVHSLSGYYLDEYRRRIVGYLWQHPERNLIPGLSAEDNIVLAQKISGFSKTNQKEWSEELLSALGLKNRRYHKPFELSGGEAQRLSLAVALANKPKVLLADEPTGELDNDTTFEIIGYLQDLNKEFELTIVVVTHDYRFERMTSQAYQILDGQLGNIKRSITGDPTVDWRRVEREEVSFVDQFGNVRIPEAIRQELKLGKYIRFSVKDGKGYFESV